jgi:hypothetical protein
MLDPTNETLSGEKQMSVEISRVRRRVLDAAYNYRTIRERLLAGDPSLADDPECLLDTLEGCTDLREAIALMLRIAKRIEFETEGLAEYINAMQIRKAERLHRAGTMRATALTIMSEHEIKKIEAPDLTASRTPAPRSVIITNENLIPERYQRIKREANRTEIKKALLNRLDVPGADLSNGGETLRITIAHNRSEANASESDNE